MCVVKFQRDGNELTNGEYKLLFNPILFQLDCMSFVFTRLLCSLSLTSWTIAPFVGSVRLCGLILFDVAYRIRQYKIPSSPYIILFLVRNGQIEFEAHLRITAISNYTFWPYSAQSPISMAYLKGMTGMDNVETLNGLYRYCPTFFHLHRSSSLIRFHTKFHTINKLYLLSQMSSDFSHFNHLDLLDVHHVCGAGGMLLRVI